MAVKTYILISTGRVHSEPFTESLGLLSKTPGSR